MLTDKEKKVLNTYDMLFGIMIFLLSAGVALHKLFFADASMAVINLGLSLIPAGYLILSKLPKKMNKQTILLFVIIFVRVITSVMSYAKLNTYDIVVQCCYDISLIVNILGIFLVIDHISIKEKFKFKNVTYALIISTLIFSIYNVIANIKSYEYFTNPKYMSLINFSSFFENRNLFGVMLLLGLFAVYYESETNKSKWLSIVKYFLILNVFLTLSRNAVLAFIVFWLTKAVVDKKYKKIVWLVIIVGFVLIINVFGITDIISTYLIRSDTMTSGRTDIWRICFNEFLKSPIVGFGELYISGIIDDITGVTSMHSWFFKLLLNGGIINALCYIVIISSITINTFKSVKKGYAYSNIAFPALIAIIIYGVFEEVNLFEFGLINMAMTFFVIILPTVINSEKRGEKLEQSKLNNNSAMLQ